MADFGAHAVGPQLEDGIYRSGLLSLRLQLGVDNLLVFPKRSNGGAVLMRQSFFEKIFNGKMEFLDFPNMDVNAAQVDVKNLNLEQLLHIRCECLDFQAASAALKTQTDFLKSVDDTLEKRIAERLAAGGGAAWAHASRMSDVVRMVLLMYGAHEKLGESQSGSKQWLLRSGNLEALLQIPSCELSRIQTGDDAPPQLSWCHRNLVRSTAVVSKAKKQLNWEVELCDRPSQFKEALEHRDNRRGRIGAAFEQRLAGGGRAAGIAVNDIQAKRQAELAAEKIGAALRGQSTSPDTENKVTRLEGELAAAKEEAQRAIAAAKASDEEASRLRRAEATSLASLQQELAAAEEVKLATLRQELASAEEGRLALQQELATMRKELEAAAEAKLASLQEELAAAHEAKLASLREELAAAASLREELAATHEASCAREASLVADLATLRQEISAADEVRRSSSLDIEVERKAAREESAKADLDVVRQELAADQEARQASNGEKSEQEAKPFRGCKCLVPHKICEACLSPTEAGDEALRQESEALRQESDRSLAALRQDLATAENARQLSSQELEDERKASAAHEAQAASLEAALAPLRQELAAAEEANRVSSEDSLEASHARETEAASLARELVAVQADHARAQARAHALASELAVAVEAQRASSEELEKERMAHAFTMEAKVQEPLRDVELQQHKNVPEAEKKELVAKALGEKASKEDEAKDDAMATSDEMPERSPEPKDDSDARSKAFEPQQRVKLDRTEAKDHPDSSSGVRSTEAKEERQEKRTEAQSRSVDDPDVDFIGADATDDGMGPRYGRQTVDFEDC